MGDYTSVTELPGQRGYREQISRLFHRYHFASGFCDDKDVLEVACGGGIGLGYLAERARKVVGGDIDEKNLEFAKNIYNDRKHIEIRSLDAHRLPFGDNSFDVLILYEAVYYLAYPEKFIDEAYRVLRDNGKLIICMVNKDWPDFNPSPHSTRYFSAEELYALLNGRFRKIDFFGAFPVSRSLKDRMVSFIKRLAVYLDIMPKTMKGKEMFKRIFFGELLDLPVEIKGGVVGYEAPIQIPAKALNRDFKVLYAVAER